jgi:hypothetical protein
VSPALNRARRRSIPDPDKVTAALTALRSPLLGQPAAVTAANAAVRSLIAVITTLNKQIRSRTSGISGPNSGSLW